MCSWVVGVVVGRLWCLMVISGSCSIIALRVVVHNMCVQLVERVITSLLLEWEVAILEV